jgi:hypothetical protein
MDEVDGSAPRRRPPGPIDLTRYEIEPAWACFQTFSKMPVCLTPEDLVAGKIDVAIGGAPWDGTAISRSGTHMGPQAIRSSDYRPVPPRARPHLGVGVDPFEHLNMCDYGDDNIIIGDVVRRRHRRRRRHPDHHGRRPRHHVAERHRAGRPLRLWQCRGRPLRRTRGHCSRGARRAGESRRSDASAHRKRRRQGPGISSRWGCAATGQGRML